MLSIEQLLRRRSSLHSQDGVTLVEVIVTALMVGLIGFTLVGLDAAGQTTADQRNRSEAARIAEQDQERIKGLSADQISTLNQTRTVTANGVAYEVTSTGKFLSASDNTASCSSGAAAADYAKVVSTVNWDANKTSTGANRRPPVVEQSVITPSAGGSVLVKVNDPAGAPLPGAGISLAGSAPTTAAIRRRGGTDSDGCVIFGAILPGDYTLTGTLAGYVDPQGNTSVGGPVTATAGNTASKTFSLGKAGSLRATFTTKVNGATLTGQKAAAISWNNTGLLTPGKATLSSAADSISSPKTLYPFTTGTSSYTNNYSVWAGSCSSDMPSPAANVRYATVSPGATNAPATVQMPGMVLKVRVNNQTVVPDRVVLKDACGDSWQPEIAANADTSSTGALKYPGQPYSSNYTVCAEATGYMYLYGRYYQVPFHDTETVSNTNFTTGTTKTIDIPTGYPYSGYGSC